MKKESNQILNRNFTCELFRVLIVEDDEGLNLLIKRKLKIEGFIIQTVTNGNDAIELITGEQNEIILLDISLPDKSGKAVIEEVIQQKSIKPYFVVMTGFGDEKIAVEMMKLGAQDYLIKDTDFIEIIGEKTKSIAERLHTQNKLLDIEKNLVLSQNLLELTGQMALVGGWELSVKTNIVKWTSTTYAIHDLDEGSEIELKHALDYFENESKAKLIEAIDITRTKGIPYDLELNFISAKNVKKIVHVKGLAEKENGEIVKLYGSIQDITARKQNEIQLQLINQKLLAGEQQLRAANQQLKAREQQLKATNKALAEKQLELLKSEEKLRSIIENSTNLFYSHNTDYEVTFLSPQVKKYLGYSVEEARVLWTDLLTDNPINQKGKAITKKAINTGKIQAPFDLELKKKNGKKIRVEVHEAPLVKNGKTIAMVGSLTDITKRYEYQHEIEVRKKHLQSLLENPSGYVIYRNKYDREKNRIEVVEVSPSFIEVLGISEADKYIFENWFQYVHSEDLPTLLNASNEGMKPPFTINQRFRYLHPEQGLKWLEVRAKGTSFEDDPQMIEYANGIILDVTEQQLAQERLKTNEERLKEAERIAKMGNFSYDVKSKIGNWSEETFQIYERELDKGHPDIHEAIAMHIEEDRPKLIEAFDEAITKGKEFELWLKAVVPSGKLKYILLIGRIIKEKSGKVEFIRGIVQDITMQKEYEKALVEAREKAEESDRLKSAFLANMSHEIRTPMNGILGFTELLKETDFSTEERDRFIDIIHRNGERMLNTVNDIIDISKIDSGQVELNYERFDVIEEIATLYDFFSQQSSQKGLKLIVNKAMNLNTAVIHCDKLKFQSILTNLISNAIKYTHSGKIEIIYGNNTNGFYFKIKDTGIGIPKNRQKAVFDRFVQADIEDKHAYEGSGLGLAICKSYVELLNGTISLESEPGKGSCFEVNLPYKFIEASSNVSHEKHEIPKMNDHSNMKVLVVEDDNSSYKYLEIILKNRIGELSRAVNGQEAIDRLKNETFDLVLMDLKLPIISGFEAVRTIRTFDDTTRIVAQTAYAMMGDREKAIEAGCDDYLEKPIKKADIIRILHSV